MITDIILNFFYFFVNVIMSIFRVFGTVPVNSDISAGIAKIASSLSPLAGILPIGTLLAIIAVDLVFETIYFTYKLIRWGYQKVPGVN